VLLAILMQLNATQFFTVPGSSTMRICESS